MTAYELIQNLVDYPPEAEIIFDCNDETTYDFSIRYKKFLGELQAYLEE